MKYKIYLESQAHTRTFNTREEAQQFIDEKLACLVDINITIVEVKDNA